MTLPKTVRLLPEAFIQDLGGQTAVVLHTRTEKYYSLNEEATRLLHLMRDCSDVGEILERFQREYEVERPELEGDFLELVQGLSAAGLVAIEPA